MNISLLNDLIKEVYVNKCHTSFEIILVDIDNIIKRAAQNTYVKYEDKILNEIEDIQQNISIKIYTDFSSILFNFEEDKELERYIFEIAEEMLQETRG